MAAGNGSRGFTLFEVMISISIVAIVFISLFKMQSQTLQVAESGTFNTIAPYLAKNTIASIRDSLQDETEMNGGFGDDYPGYQWRASITGYETIDKDLISSASAELLKGIRIEISKDDHRFYLNTWRYVPDE